MKIKQLLLTAAAALILTTTGAAAFDRDHDGRPDRGWAEHHDHDGYRDRDWHGDRGWGDRGWHGHDRYWREGYRDYARREWFYRDLRAHHFYRWDGEPYWYRDRYVVRSYDRWGRPVFVEMNPYTGSFIGVIRF